MHNYRKSRADSKAQSQVRRAMQKTLCDLFKIAFDQMGKFPRLLEVIRGDSRILETVKNLKALRYN
jgi:hypothetical protein